MAMSARELVFYVRAENQASRVFKSVGRDIGALRRQAAAARNITAVSAATNTALKGRDQTIKQLGTINGLTQTTYRNQLKQAQAEQSIIRARQQGNRLIDQANAAYDRRLRITNDIGRAQVRANSLGRIADSGKGLGILNNAEVGALAASSAAEVERLEHSLRAAEQAEDSVRLAGQRWAKDNEVAQLEARRAKWDGYASSVRNAGHSLQILGSAGLVASAYTAKKAADFQTATTLAATQMITRSRNSVQQILSTGSFVDTQLTKMLAAGHSVLSPKDAAQAAYDIPSGIPSLRGNSVAKAKQTISIIKELNTVMKANFGLVDLNGLVDASIVLVNTFGTSIKNLPHEFDVMQSAVNRGKITMGQFVAGLAKTGPAAKAAHYSFDQMAATLSFLSDKITNYSVVTVGYARSIDLFQNPKLQAYMKAQGHSITDASGRLLSYTKIIQQLDKVFPDLRTKHANLFADLKNAIGQTSTVQARRVITVASQDPKGLAEAARAVPRNAKGLVNAQATALSATGAVKWAQLKTEFQAIAIILGQKMIPAFQRLAKPIEEVVNRIRDMSPHTQDLIAKVAVFGSMAALLLGTLMVMIAPFIHLVAVIRDLKFMLISSEAGFSSVNTLMRVGMLGAVIALIYAYFRFHRQLEPVIRALGGLKGVLIAITAVMVGLKFGGLITGLLGVATQAKAATAEVDALRLSLLSIEGMVITAAIIIGVEVIMHRKQITKVVNDAITKITGGLVKNPNDKKPQGYDEQLRSAQQEAKAWHMTVAQAAKQTMTPKQWHWFQLMHPQATGKLGGVTKDRQDENNARAVAQRANAHAVAVKAAKDAKRHDVTVARQNWEKFKATPYIEKVASQVAKIDAAIAKHPYNSVGLLKKKAAIEKAAQAKLGTDLFSIYQQYLSAIESADKKSTSKQVSEAKKRAAALKKIMEDAQKKVTADAQALQSKYSEMYQQNVSNFGTLFQGPFMNSPRTQDALAGGGKPTGSMLLTDFKSQISQYKQFNRVWTQLQKSGAPVELLQQLWLAGPSVLPEMRALLSLPKPQLRQYYKLFKSVFGQGGLLTKTTKGEMATLLKGYRTMGQKAAQAFIDGVQDMHTPALAVFTNIIKGLFPNLWKDAHGKGADPTKKSGLKDHTVPAKPPKVTHTQHGSRVGGGRGTRSDAIAPSVTYNFHSVVPMDPSTLLRKAKNFHAANYPRSPVTTN